MHINCLHLDKVVLPSEFSDGGPPSGDCLCLASILVSALILHLVFFLRFIIWRQLKLTLFEGKESLSLSCGLRHEVLN